MRHRNRQLISLFLTSLIAFPAFALESDAGGFVPRGFTMDGTKEQVAQMQNWESLLEPYKLHIFNT